MGAENILPVKGIKIKIGDKPYGIRFTMKALAQMAARFGTVNGLIEKLSTSFASGGMTEENLHDLSYIVFAALAHDGQEITQDYIEDNIDIGDIIEMLPFITEAFALSMGNKAKKAEGENPPKV